MLYVTYYWRVPQYAAYLILVQVYSSSLCVYHPYYYSIWLVCLLLWRTVGNTSVYHSIQIIKDLLGQMIIFWLSVWSYIFLWYMSECQTDRCHRGLLWIDIPLKNTSLLWKRQAQESANYWTTERCDITVRLRMLLDCIQTSMQNQLD